MSADSASRISNSRLHRASMISRSKACMCRHVMYRTTLQGEHECNKLLQCSTTTTTMNGTRSRNVDSRAQQAIRQPRQANCIHLTAKSCRTRLLSPALLSGACAGCKAPTTISPPLQRLPAARSSWIDKLKGRGRDSVTEHRRSGSRKFTTLHR